MFANDNAIVHIKWCNFKSDFTDEFKSLLQTGELSDIRIGLVDGSKICAHKIILRNGSEHFRDIFNVRPKSRFIKLPIDAMSVKFAIFFMYHGEVNIPKRNLGAFLEAAKLLRLKGFQTVSKSDLSTDRNLNINLGNQSDEYWAYMKKYYNSHQNNVIAPTGKQLRKKVKRSVTFNNDLVCRSKSISRANSRRSCRKSTNFSHPHFADDNSSSSLSNIDFSEYKKTPSDGQSSPEIVD